VTRFDFAQGSSSY